MCLSPFPSCVSQREGQTWRTPQGTCPGRNVPWEVASRPLMMGGMAADQVGHAWLSLRGLLTSRTSAPHPPTPELRVQSRCRDRDQAPGLAGQREGGLQSSLRSDGSRSHGDLAARDLKCSTSLQPRSGPGGGQLGNGQAHRVLTWALSKVKRTFV